MKRWTIIFLGIALALGCAPAKGETQAEKEPLAWRDWSDQVFEQARKENKLVILDLEAVWCHWCHVMAETTYRDPKVVELIRTKFIPLRVDQDAHPDISLRYEDWGWPATVIFAPDGKEIVKRRGYIAPQPMAALLQAVIENPTPGPSAQPEAGMAPSEQGFLTPAQQQKLEAEHAAYYDKEFGGWGRGHKLIDAASLELAMRKAAAGDKEEEARARRTLDQALNLLDLEWGGFFQYSDEDNWKSPHFEKIMSYQAQYLRQYAQASAQWNDPRYLDAAKKTAGYVERFWTSPDGAFYVSQDADVDANFRGAAFYKLTDAERLKLGRAPRLDTHLYGRENGWMIASLATLYETTGDEKFLKQAERAAGWALANRSLPGGGFRHDTADRAGPYLGDTLYLGRAFLELYVATGDRKWLAASEKAAAFIQKNFPDEKEKGFITAPVPANATGAFQKPVKQVDENVDLARWANLLFRTTGKAEYKEMAKQAMQYLASPALLENRRFLTGILLADREIKEDPTHVTIVGSKGNTVSKELYQAALRQPILYRRIEWWDPQEGPLPNPDVTYPVLDKPAAFLCQNGACSQPAFTVEKFQKMIKKY